MLLVIPLGATPPNLRKINDSLRLVEYDAKTLKPVNVDQDSGVIVFEAVK
jgi:hypothetical protein